MTQKVRKAVFPVGGLGTRFLPATKAMPKEMLPVVDKPLIQYAVEEAIAAGIEELIFVTGRGKSIIEDHFDRSFELEETLRVRGLKVDHVTLGVPKLSPGSVTYTRQQEPLGLGHAVWCARHLIKNEPFAVLLADDFIHSTTPCLQQMINAYQGGIMTAVMNVDPAHVSRYGIIDIASEQGSLVQIKGVVEKPAQDRAPSSLAIIGRYILDARVFEHLACQEKGAGGEIQLTDALACFINQMPFYGFRFEGKRYDCGTKSGLLLASLAVALKSNIVSDELVQDIEMLLNEHKKK
ncbi:MAG: UTP--glucose-1-phosphate uridylyltransferase GalU [Janthinobacterium lividum]